MVKFSQDIEIHKGRLEGWHAAKNEESRHRAIRRAVERHGYATTIRELNLLHSLDQRHDSKVARQAETDLHWLQRERADGAKWTE